MPTSLRQRSAPSRLVLLITVTAICVVVASSRGVPSLALTNAGSITALGVPLSENFDTLAQTSTNIPWTDNSTIPGWYSTRTTYNTGTGSSNTGALYSFGIAGTNPVTDRALGSVGSGSTGTIYWAARFTNNTGATITSLDISYVGEQWRNGGATAPAVSVAQTVDFQYQIAGAGVVTGANAPSTGWINHDPLDFTSPTFGTSAAATLDGNAAANRTAKAATLAVTIPNGQEIWLRWSDVDHTGNDHGLAIDDLSVTASGVPPGDDAPSVTTTTPANGATNVAVGSAIVINFNESVTATASAFSIQCPTGTPQTFSQTASPASSFTLTPTSALPFSTTCTVTVTAAQISDTDTTDPPDQMASDFVFSFTTIAAADDAPTVTGTTPANGAAGVSVDSTIVINFSESVTAGASAFSLQCPAGSPQAFTQSASPAGSFTLTPTAALPFSTTCTVTVTASQIADTDTNDPPDQMASDYTFFFTTAAPVAGNIIINEVDADTPGTDAAEFVELFDGGVGHTSLDGLVLVFFNGNGDISYKAFDLDGFFTDENGYFTIGNAGVPGVDLIFDPGPAGFLQNGADAVALYAASAPDFPDGTPVTTANLRDAVVYGTDDPNDTGLLVLLNALQPQVNDTQTQSMQRCPNGTGGARNTSAFVQATPSPDGVNTCVPPPPPSTVVISQLYGGGGNALATYQRDFVELYNRSSATVDLTGWSLQYASATGSGWDFSKQPLGGSIGPGQYYLIALAGGPIGAPLPDANINGQLNMSATAGKVALVDSFDGLIGNCPLADPHVKDFVGYGSSADCREGPTAAPAPSNTTSLFRLGAGAVDTNNNGADFATGTPFPRQTEPIVELGPMVLSTDPRTNGFNAPRDATIQVTFTEPVDVIGTWFDITCVTSGQHTSTTEAGSGQNHFITPNVDFAPGEQCTVTLFKNQIHDQDLEDAGPDTDTLRSNYVWSFTVSSGAAPPYPASEHLVMGNPSGAVASIGVPNNYLMEKAEYALSYNRDLGRPNWVSWHLSDEWVGTLTRVDSFRPDPRVPADWYRVQSFDFSGSGFDRGHMVPNADRNNQTSIPINQATFLMTNMLAQAPDNNQGPWGDFEEYLRTLLPAKELYIVAGGAGAGGSGDFGATTTIANGHVTVPAFTWKVALVLPKDSGNDVSRVDCSTRSIAVILPNTNASGAFPWEHYLTNVDAVEALTGYDLFSNLPLSIQACVEAGINGNNPPEDKTAPSVVCTPADGMWHTDNVTLNCTATDSGSGLLNPGDASFSLVTSIAAGTEDGDASTNSRIVCDIAGNCKTAVVTGNKIDRKAPTITLTTPASGAIYQRNQVVNAVYSCPDGGSGFGSCIGTVNTLSPIDTSTLGTKAFTVDATDAAGNSSSTTVNYEVRQTLTAVGPAAIWIGLKNSDDVGLRLDLRTELLVDGNVAATGDLQNIATGSSGFNNAILNSVAMALASGPVEVPPDTDLSLRVSVRRTCSGTGHNSGRVREWFNGQPIDTGASRDAGSRIQLTIAGVTNSYFLRSAFGLSTTAGASKDSVELTVNSSQSCMARPYSVLGVWGLSLQ